jgi:predicted nucleic acid-binding protein
VAPKKPKRVYWDSCVFLGLVNPEEAKHQACRAVQVDAEDGNIEIVTSAFTLTEVFKKKCEGKARPLSEEGDERIEQYFQSPYIFLVQVDRNIATHARRLMRRHSELEKPQDAIHLASALRLNVDEMHTYDGADLLRLNGVCLRADGAPLVICTPRVERESLPLLDAMEAPTADRQPPATGDADADAATAAAAPEPILAEGASGHPATAVEGASELTPDEQGDDAKAQDTRP